MAKKCRIADYLDGRLSKEEDAEVTAAIANSKSLFSIASTAAAIRACRNIMDENGCFVGLENLSTERKRR